MFSYFTVTTANHVLPDVIKKYNLVQQQKSEITKIEQQLQLTASTPYDFEQYVTIKQKLNSIVAKFYQLLEDLENTGVVVKSLDQGLLDFPSKHFDEEVWLCWKEGETEVKFWHEKDSGFNGRKPVEVSDESLV